MISKPFVGRVKLGQVALNSISSHYNIISTWNSDLAVFAFRRALRGVWKQTPSKQIRAHSTSTLLQKQQQFAPPSLRTLGPPLDSVPYEQQLCPDTPMKFLARPRLRRSTCAIIDHSALMHFDLWEAAVLDNGLQVLEGPSIATLETLKGAGRARQRHWRTSVNEAARALLQLQEHSHNRNNTAWVCLSTSCSPQHNQCRELSFNINNLPHFPTPVNLDTAVGQAYVEELRGLARVASESGAAITLTANNIVERELLKSNISGLRVISLSKLIGRKMIDQTIRNISRSHEQCEKTQVVR